MLTHARLGLVLLMLSTTFVSEALAITRGVDDRATLSDNAVVRIGGGNSGVLVRNDLVLTAGHCFFHGQASPAQRYSDNNWEFPNQWYPILNGPVRVSVGSDTNCLAARYRSNNTETEFMLEVVGGGSLDNGDQFRLRTPNGWYVMAYGGGGGFVGCESRNSLTWESFQLTKVTGVATRRVDSGTTIRLQSNDGKFLALQREGTKIEARATAITTPTEAISNFTIEGIIATAGLQHGDRVRIRAANGQYLGAAAGGGGGEFAFNAVEYAIPGYADMMLLRLDRPVPPSVATPAKVLTALPAELKGWEKADADRFWSTQNFSVQGWGNTGTKITSLRQRADGRGARTFATGIPDKLLVNLNGGARTESGDSGAPIFWDKQPRERYVIGVVQQSGSSVMTINTFSPGGRIIGQDNISLSARPAIGLWLASMLNQRDERDLSGYLLGASKPPTRDKDVPDMRFSDSRPFLWFQNTRQRQDAILLFHGLRAEKICPLTSQGIRIFLPLRAGGSVVSGPVLSAEVIVQRYDPATIRIERKLNPAPGGDGELHWYLVDGADSRNILDCGQASTSADREAVFCGLMHVLAAIRADGCNGIGKIPGDPDAFYFRVIS